MITQKRLKELLTYNEKTGLFTRACTRGNGGRWKAGSVAGSINKINGYVEIWADGKPYTGHRLAFLAMTGSFPPKNVDHADLNRSNNVWANLRASTQLQNTWNTPKNRLNTSGVKGVSLRKDTGRWSARIKAEGRYLSLGSFDTLPAAANAYRQAAIRFRAEFARC
jgi:hypothetical protein